MVDKETRHLGRRKVMALLAYLALTQRPQSRAHLGTLLWPGYDGPAAPAFEQWQLFTAQAVRQEVSWVLERLTARLPCVITSNHMAGNGLWLRW